MGLCRTARTTAAWSLSELSLLGIVAGPVMGSKCPMPWWPQFASGKAMPNKVVAAGGGVAAGTAGGVVAAAPTVGAAAGGVVAAAASVGAAAGGVVAAAASDGAAGGGVEAAAPSDGAAGGGTSADTRSDLHDGGISRFLPGADKDLLLLPDALPRTADGGPAL